MVTGPGLASDPERWRRLSVRRINGMELMLTSVCMAAAHLLLEIDWTADTVLGALIAFAGAPPAIV